MVFMVGFAVLMEEAIEMVELLNWTAIYWWVVIGSY